MGTNIHLAISNTSCVGCKLFPAQRQECKTVQELWKDWPWDKIKSFVADKAYATGPVRRFLKSKKVDPVIPLKGVYLPEDSTLTPKDFYDTKLYKTRHIIERLFGRIKENKRIAMRFDKLDCTFLSFIALAISKAYHLFC